MSQLAEAIAGVLHRLGVARGRHLFVHSGIGQLKHLPGGAGASPRETVAALHQALTGTVGPEGTIAAPAFFYDYARHGKPFHLESSPPDRSLGLYPLALFGQEGVRRSLNPICSVQALGAAAETICRHDSAYGYGYASPWQRLVELDAETLIIGTPYTLTFVHHPEVLVGVPHIYNKLYRTPVYVGDRAIELPVVTAVRYLKYDIVYSTERISQDLVAEGVIRTIDEHGVNAQLLNLRRFQDWLIGKLQADPYYLLAHPPRFVPGEPPDDGNAGAMRR